MSDLSHRDCEAAFARLADYVDRELSPEELGEVRQHLERCAVCAREFGFEIGVLEALREKICRIQMPPDLVARISAAIAREREALSDP